MANEKITLATAGGNKEVIAKDGFAPTAFICNASGKLEPTVRKGTSLTGNGSALNPLAVKLSTDAGNDLSFGTDGGVYVDIGTIAYSFSVDGDAGAPQLIGNGDILRILGGDSISTATGASDTLTISLDLSGDSGNAATIGTDNNIYVALPTLSDICPDAYFTGAPV